MLKIRRCIHFGDIIRHVIFSWLVAVFIEYSMLSTTLRDLNSLEGLKEMSLLRVIGICAIAFIIVSLSSLKWNTLKFERYAILGLYAFLAVMR